MDKEVVHLLICWHIKCYRCQRSLDGSKVTVRNKNAQGSWNFQAECTICGLEFTGIANVTPIQAIGILGDLNIKEWNNWKHTEITEKDVETFRSTKPESIEKELVALGIFKPFVSI